MSTSESNTPLCDCGKGLRALIAWAFGGEENVPKYSTFKPHLRYNRGINRLDYLTKDCSYVLDSFGLCFSVLVLSSGGREKVVGVSLEPFSGLVMHVRKTYPGLGTDGRGFALWPLIALTTEEEYLFPSYSRKRVADLLPKIRKLVSGVEISFSILEEVCHGKTVSVVSRREV